MERRNSNRIQTPHLFVRERNGEYIYNLRAEDLSEEGMFVSGKMLTQEQDYVSYLSFHLPNGSFLNEVPAKMVREERKDNRNGIAYNFVSMDEKSRILLKKFLLTAANA